MRGIHAFVERLRCRVDGPCRRARAPEGTTDIDGTATGYGLRTLCDVGILYVDDACIVSRSPRRFAKIIEVIVEVCRAFALTVSEKKIEAMPCACLHGVYRRR